MKAGTGHSSSFFSEKFSHLNIDKVCHWQALFVFLLLLLLHISSHALALSPVSVLHFSSPSPIFAPRRQLCSKSRGLSRENRRVFRQKSTSFATKQTSKIRYLAFPLGYPPAPHFHRGVSMRNGSISKKSYGLFAARSPQFRSCVPRNTPRIPTSISPFSIYLIPLSFWPPERGDSAEKAHLCITFCTILHKRWGVR